MSRADLPRVPGLERPARRRALFAVGDAMLAGLAAASLPANAQGAATPALRVMHGFADHQSITLWLQGARTQQLEIDVRAGDASGAILQTLPLELTARTDFTETVSVAGLDEGQAHHYAIRARDSATVLAQGAFRTQRLWQWRTDPPMQRIAIGSCAYLNEPRFERPGKPYGGGEEIFDTIAAQDPDLMLWLGDNIYLREADYTSREGINRRYRFYRSHPSLAKLLAAAPHVAIWDDHDFGPDNSDFSYAGAGWSRELFQRYWPLPFAAPADALYGKVLQGDVDIFMLDGRSFRYPQYWPEGEDKALYGAKQLLWLKAALTASRAPFKVIAGGSQFFNRVRSHAESWARYPAEQAEFLRWLAERRIPGVLFLSGDRHFAQHLRVQRDGLYPLNEITTSPLTSSVSTPSTAERNNPDMVPGTLLGERNFALMTVSGPRAQRELTIEIRDARNRERWSWSTTAAQLAEGTRA